MTATRSFLRSFSNARRHMIIRTVAISSGGDERAEQVAHNNPPPRLGPVPGFRDTRAPFLAAPAHVVPRHSGEPRRRVNRAFGAERPAGRTTPTMLVPNVRTVPQPLDTRASCHAGHDCTSLRSPSECREVPQDHFFLSMACPGIGDATSRPTCSPGRRISRAARRHLDIGPPRTTCASATASGRHRGFNNDPARQACAALLDAARPPVATASRSSASRFSRKVPFMRDRGRPATGAACRQLARHQGIVDRMSARPRLGPVMKRRSSRRKPPGATKGDVVNRPGPASRPGAGFSSARALNQRNLTLVSARFTRGAHHVCRRASRFPASPRTGFVEQGDPCPFSRTVFSPSLSPPRAPACCGVWAAATTRSCAPRHAVTERPLACAVTASCALREDAVKRQIDAFQRARRPPS